MLEYQGCMKHLVRGKRFKKQERVRDNTHKELRKNTKLHNHNSGPSLDPHRLPDCFFSFRLVDPVVRVLVGPSFSTDVQIYRYTCCELSLS